MVYVEGIFVDWVCDVVYDVFDGKCVLWVVEVVECGVWLCVGVCVEVVDFYFG